MARVSGTTPDRYVSPRSIGGYPRAIP